MRQAAAGLEVGRDLLRDPLHLRLADEDHTLAKQPLPLFHHHRPAGPIAEALKIARTSLAYLR
jgi:hypothetical protein